MLIALLGAWGFLQVGQEFTPGTALFSALQLFVLNSGALGGLIPWQLEVARWIAPVLSSALLVEGFLALGVNVRNRLKARWVGRGHTIIVGLGRKGQNLASDLHRCRRSVVGVDKDPLAVAEARASGITCLSGDAALPNILESARVTRASRVVFLTKFGETNVLAALETSALHPQVSCYAHVPSITQRNLFYRQNVLIGGKSRVFLFNYFERLARLSLLRYPVESLEVGAFVHSDLGLLGVKVCTAHPPHVFVRTGEDFTEAICSAIARVVHLPLIAERNWTKARVILAGTNVTEWRTRVLQMFPTIGNAIDLETLEPNQGESAAQAIAGVIIGLPEDCPATVFLGLNDASASFCEALIIADAVMPHDDSKGPVLRCIFDFSEHDAIRRVIESNERLSRCIFPLPSLCECCGSRILFEDYRDSLAKLIHHHYGGDSWETLSAELQESNRAAADHIGVILRATGRTPDELAQPEFQWSPQELETLAEAEHRRWSAQKWLDGWTAAPGLGEEQDKKTKCHGCLGRNYADLSEKMKDRDRSNVLLTGKLLRLLDNTQT